MNSSLISNRQVSMNHWNPAGLLIRPNVTLIHSYKPHGVIKAVKGLIQLYLFAVIPLLLHDQLLAVHVIKSASLHYLYGFNGCHYVVVTEVLKYFLFSIVAIYLL